MRIHLQDDAKERLGAEAMQKWNARIVLDQLYGAVSDCGHLFGRERAYVPYEELSQLYGPLCVKPGHMKRLLEKLRPIYRAQQQERDYLDKEINMNGWHSGSEISQNDVVIGYTSMGGVSISEVPSDNHSNNKYASIERIVLEEFMQP